MFKTDEKQQELLEKFFAEENTWFPDNVLHPVLAGIFFFIAVVQLLFPYLSLEGDTSIISFHFLTYTWGCYFLILKYTTYTELKDGRKKTKRVYDLLRFFPIDTIQLSVFCFRKLIKPCLYMTIPVVAFRNVVSYAVYGRLSVWDLVIPVGICLLWPILLEVSDGWISSRKQ